MLVRCVALATSRCHSGTGLLLYRIHRALNRHIMCFYYAVLTNDLEQWHTPSVHPPDPYDGRPSLGSKCLAGLETKQKQRESEKKRKKGLARGQANKERPWKKMQGKKSLSMFANWLGKRYGSNLSTGNRKQKVPLVVKGVNFFLTLEPCLQAATPRDQQTRCIFLRPLLH